MVDPVYKSEEVIDFVSEKILRKMAIYTHCESSGEGRKCIYTLLRRNRPNPGIRTCKTWMKRKSKKASLAEINREKTCPLVFLSDGSHLESSAAITSRVVFIQRHYFCQVSALINRPLILHSGFLSQIKIKVGCSIV